MTERSHCIVISFHFAQVFISVIDRNLKGVVRFWKDSLIACVTASLCSDDFGKEKWAEEKKVVLLCF